MTFGSSYQGVWKTEYLRNQDSTESYHLPVFADIKQLRICISPEFKDALQLISLFKLKKATEFFFVNCHGYGQLEFYCKLAYTYTSKDNNAKRWLVQQKMICLIYENLASFLAHWVKRYYGWILHSISQEKVRTFFPGFHHKTSSKFLF